MKPNRLILILVLLVIALSISPTTYAFTPPTAPPEQGPAGGVQSTPINLGTGTRVQVQMTDKPPEVTDAQKAALAQRDARGPLPAASPLPVGTNPANRPDSVKDPSKAVDPPLRQADRSPSAPAAPGDLLFFRNTTMGATIKANTSGLTGEPTLVNQGPFIFATGNWWGSISRDGGKSYSYMNPATMFPASAGGFCCDQWSAYDPGRDIIIWYLQYISSGSPGSGTNLYRLAVARPSDAVNGYWWYWDIGSATNTEWDYPDIALTENYLYITTNRGVFNSGSVNNAFVYKWPLDQLAAGGSLGGGVLDFCAAGYCNLSWKLTRGAVDVMYMAAHIDTSHVRIFWWGDNTGTLYHSDITLSATWPNSTHSCPTPDGKDWCGFTDGRITAGWVSHAQNVIGFMWSASAGLGWTYPYIEALRVKKTDMSYVDRPNIYSTYGAHQYPGAGVNLRGDASMTGYYSANTSPYFYDPYFYVAVSDDYTRNAAKSWDVGFVRASSQGPNGNRWGDYFAVHQQNPSGLGWETLGTTMQGCGGVGCKETNYVLYGRARDTNGIQKFMDAVLCLYLPNIYR